LLVRGLNYETYLYDFNKQFERGERKFKDDEYQKINDEMKPSLIKYFEDLTS